MDPRGPIWVRGLYAQRLGESAGRGAILNFQTASPSLGNLSAPERDVLHRRAWARKKLFQSATFSGVFGDKKWVHAGTLCDALSACTELNRCTAGS